MKNAKYVLTSLFLASCSQAPSASAPISKQPSFIITSSPLPLEEKVEEVRVTTDPLNFETTPCPEGMANIGNKFCIDRYEASVVDKFTRVFASPHYIPSQEGYHDADWQYDIFSKMEIDEKILSRLITEGQPVDMPVHGAEQYQTFEPFAVSVPGKIPASYVNKVTAEQACENAGKRLCTRKEWYKACVGPDRPAPYFEERKKNGEKDVVEIFPEVRPYGDSYQKGKCNLGLQINRWPPGILGRKNNGQMLDPRISVLLGTDGQPMKRATGSFPECTNGYGVYDMLGNVHEIVSDTRIATKFPRERVTYVGSHYARSGKESCAEVTADHWASYTDYSLGFRCCTDIKEGNIQH